MPDYRAYIIGIDGRYIRAEFLNNHSDYATAMKAAERIVDGYYVEIWERDRLVVRLTHQPKW